MGGQPGRIFVIRSNRLMAAVCGALVGLGLVGAIGLVAFGGYSPVIFITAIGFAIIAPLLLGAYMIPMSRAYLADIDRMLVGHSWAHWRYDEASWSIALGAKRPARGGQQSTGEVYISPIGVYARPGDYTPLFGAGLALRAIELDESRAPRLRFCGVTVNPGASGIALPTDIVSLAVPRGHEAEARDLVSRFRTEILPGHS